VEHHDLTDELHRRLRAARPAAARVDEHAFDGDLLSRVRQGPIAARRALPRSVAMPIAAGVIVVATAAVVLGGGPDSVGGPASAAAITQQTLSWLDPPAGTILHVRSVETLGAQTTTREYWESADDPHAERELVEGTTTYEVSGDALYDPATNTIYDPYSPKSTVGRLSDQSKGATDTTVKNEVPADQAKGANQSKGTITNAAPAAGGKAGQDSAPAADPVVSKVRVLLEEGVMTVTGRELHDGIDTWAVSLKADVGRPVWTLWVAVADGKPVELRDPGSNASQQPQVIRWPVYEVLGADSSTQQLLTLTGAHPSAQVVHDPAQAAAAAQRLESLTP
jgi:hypothetical protein